MTRRVAFLTCEALADGHPDDLRAVPALHALDVEVDFIPWRRTPDWGRWDAVVIRTTWDYQHHASEFFAMLDSVESAGTPLWNPSNVARWNADKIYLKELKRRGVRVVPSTFANFGSRAELDVLWREVDQGEGVVVKPRVGASGEDTWLLTEDAEEGTIDEVVSTLRGRDVVVQPFLSSVLEFGERSATFIEGRISHLFEKRPRAGEFRSQEEHGGSVEGIRDKEFEAWATSVAAATPETSGLLYFRVDGLRDETGEWCVGELELIEPKLYLECAPGSERRFAEALASRLHRGPER